MAGKKIKTSEKNIKNPFKIIILISIVIISTFILFLALSDSFEITEPYESLTVTQIIDNYFVDHTTVVTNDSMFLVNFTSRDIARLQQNLPVPVDGMKIGLRAEHSELFELLRPNPGTVVVYPLFTSPAYDEPGFYTYFAGNCDERCITDLSFENPSVEFTSSGMTTQILHLLGYEFVTDIDVDRNPKILEKYDTVILLHNEYVTKKMFDAITSHPNLIFLFPNALYAEIDVNYKDNTMTLIRGHNYPEQSIANGFDYEIEERFHDYEYDIECFNWEFIEIENGYHLNCYPDGMIQTDLNILLKMKEL